MLDLETLHFSSAVSRGAYLALFLVLALRQREEPYLWHWIGAILASLLGTVILAEDPVSMQLSTWESMQLFVLYMASFTLSWSGLRHFYGRDACMPVLLVFTVLPSLFCLLVPWMGFSAHTIFILFLLCAAAAAIMVVVEIVRAKREQLWSQLVVAVAFTAYAASFLMAAGMLRFTKLQVSTEMARISMIFDQVTSILVYVGYVAMSGERANLKLRELAETDPLTGLFNRRGIQHALQQSPHTERVDQPVSVLIGDLDHFKKINDTLGHDGGDAVLKTFTKRLKNLMRSSDMAVRWGGEEFLVVLPQTGIDEAEVFAERLRKLIETDPFLICGERLDVTISIGIAETDRQEETFDKAIQRADQALYRAKREGRNRVCR